MAIAAMRQGRYALLEADLDGDAVVIGVLLEDPESNELWVRLRRDWQAIAPDDPVLPLLEQDFDLKAAEMGAEGLFAWLEGNASANLRTTDRETVVVDKFDRTLNRLYAKHVRSTMAGVPRFSLQAAAGKFLENDEVEEEGHEELRPGLTPRPGMFAAHIAGTSMEPVIPDGSVALFQAGVTGSRQGRLVLVEENGSRYTLKKYTSRKVEDGEGGWRHGAIVLEPLNDEHEPIVLSEDETRYRIVAEFVDVLY